jgi:hypothetical protein
MEQMESLVVRVASDSEIYKIKAMEAFGWNLQGRQEIHEKGVASAQEHWISPNTYVIEKV